MTIDSGYTLTIKRNHTHGRLSSGSFDWWLTDPSGEVLRSWYGTSTIAIRLTAWMAVRRHKRGLTDERTYKL